MAGAGVKAGFVYGATDDYGYYATVDKMHRHHLHATLLHLLGIDHTRLTDIAAEVAKKIIAQSPRRRESGSCLSRIIRCFSK